MLRNGPEIETGTWRRLSGAQELPHLRTCDLQSSSADLSSSAHAQQVVTGDTVQSPFVAAMVFDVYCVSACTREERENNTGKH